MCRRAKEAQIWVCINMALPCATLCACTACCVCARVGWATFFLCSICLQRVLVDQTSVCRSMLYRIVSLTMIGGNHAHYTQEDESQASAFEDPPPRNKQADDREIEQVGQVSGISVDVQ